MTEPGKMTGAARLEFVRTFPVDKEMLWTYLVEDEYRRRWICGGNVEPRVGGKIEFDFDHRRLSATPAPDDYRDQQTVKFEGEVLVWEPPNRLAFSWPEADVETSTIVSISLRTVASGTEMLLVHEKLHVKDHRLGAAAGWHTHLDLLGDIVAGRNARDFWVSHAEAETYYRKNLAGVDNL